MKRLSLCFAVLCSVAVAAAYAADVKLEGVKCIVAAKNDAKADKSLDYRDGKIYFCCDNCPKSFEKDKAKFATKANHQLVQTAQTKQGKCPLSGGDLDKNTEITVAGAKVQFCCDKCKGAVEKLKGDEQIEKVFADAAFDKAEFKVEKKK